ncbi:hypothetical protein DL93DRAFT_2096487 [Clavulina sp. PMI_390]|nr:hypothetical protein DL93DRAFT_2096487 [Clavulina sp. PMI_390]
MGPDPPPSQTLYSGSHAYDDHLFADPIIGTPLAFHVHEDVHDRDSVVEAITVSTGTVLPMLSFSVSKPSLQRRGGLVTPNLSVATYILVIGQRFIVADSPDALVAPSSPGGQAIWRVYASNKRKVILDSQWVWACVQQNSILSLGHSNDWGGWKVTGTQYFLSDPPINGTPAIAALNIDEISRHGTPLRLASTSLAKTPPSTPQTVSVPPEGLAPQESRNPFLLNTTSTSFLLAPELNNQDTSSLFSQLLIPGTFPSLPESWVEDAEAAAASSLLSNDVLQNSSSAPWDEHGRSFNADLFFQNATPFNLQPQEDLASFFLNVPPTETLAEPAHPTLVDLEPPLAAAPEITSPSDRPLKRKNRDFQPIKRPPTPQNSPAPIPTQRRSPSPPRNPVRSVHGGYVFTDEDVNYLYQYIAYCKEVGLVLSLRDICERLALKAPHHTFFSWRRYCDKHKVQLGGYARDVNPSTPMPTPTPQLHFDPHSPRPQLSQHLHASSSSSTTTLHSPLLLSPSVEPESEAQAAITEGSSQRTGGKLRYRHLPAVPYLVAGRATPSTPNDFFQETEPIAPNVLHLSKSGKGVAFSGPDMDFLLRFIAFRRREANRYREPGVTLTDDINMSNLWSEVVEKAPHHTRASWVKFWRRHRHELEFTLEAAPIQTVHPSHQNLTASHGPLSSPTGTESPTGPRKRQRYSHADDVLLARYFAVHPLPAARGARGDSGKEYYGATTSEDEDASVSVFSDTASVITTITTTTTTTGSAVPPSTKRVPSTSQDAMFREFALTHPQHPWKGWQEHYRTRKTEIEFLILKIHKGEKVE